MRQFLSFLFLLCLGCAAEPTEADLMSWIETEPVLLRIREHALWGGDAHGWDIRGHLLIESRGELPDRRWRPRDSGLVDSLRQRALHLRNAQCDVYDGG